MFKSLRFLGLCLLILALIFSAPAISKASKDVSKRSLTHDDYDSWKSITRSGISADGIWVFYLETPQDGEADLVVMNLKTNKEYRHTIGYSGEGTDSERATNPQFSYDSTHVVFLISPSQEEVKKAKEKIKEKKGEEEKEKKKDEKKPKKKLGIMALSDGNVTTVERVKSFKQPKEAGGWVAYLKEAPPKPEKEEEEKAKKEEKKEVKKAEEKIEEKKKEEKKGEEEKEKKKKEKEKKYGTQLVLRSLQDKSETIFDSVMTYRFTKNGKYLLYTVSSKEKPETDGIYCCKPGKGPSVPLLAGKGNYTKWAMDKEETRLAFLTDRDDYDADEPTFNLYGWKAGEPEATLWVSHSLTHGFPKGMAVSDKSDISFSEDGQ